MAAEVQGYSSCAVQTNYHRHLDQPFIGVKVYVPFVHVPLDEKFILLSVASGQNQKVFRAHEIDELFKPVRLPHLQNRRLDLDVFDFLLGLALGSFEGFALVGYRLFLIFAKIMSLFVVVHSLWGADYLLLIIKPPADIPS